MTSRCTTPLLTACLMMAGLLLSASPDLAVAQAGDDVIERTFEVKPGQTLYLDTDRGKVRIRGGGDNAVHVRVTKDGSREEMDRFAVNFDPSSSGLRIDGDYDRDSRWRNSRLKVVFDITVPRRFEVDVKTSGGSVTLEELDGDARLRTSGGSITAHDVSGQVAFHTSGGFIEAENIGGPAKLRTSGGSITAYQIDGWLEANTSGGNIRAERVRGDVDAQTSGGRIHLEDIAGIVNAQTSGGSITADVMNAPDGPMTLKTSGGSITLNLASDTRADINARASGGVRTDFPILTQGTIRRNRLEGTIGGGGPLLTLRTSGGGIRINRR